MMVSQLVATTVSCVYFPFWYAGGIYAMVILWSAFSVPYMYFSLWDTCETYLVVRQWLVTSVSWLSFQLWDADGLSRMGHQYWPPVVS